MKIVIHALSISTISILMLIASASAFAADPTPAQATPAADKGADDLDARINSLQSTKDCISNAKSRGGVTNCSTNVKIRTHEVIKPASH